MKNKAQADRVLVEARGEAGKTNKGFRDLVSKYTSDEESKLRGGDLRYLQVGTKDALAPVVGVSGLKAGRVRAWSTPQRHVLHPQGPAGAAR